MTTRRLMVLVAVVALAIGTWTGIDRRRDRLERIADGHLQRIEGLIIGGTPPHGYRVWTLGKNGQPLSERQQSLDVWNLRLFYKYQDAARRPWLPVPPDPREPR